MIRTLAISLLLGGQATSAAAQLHLPRLPVIIPLRESRQPQAQQPGAAQPSIAPGMLQGALVASSGSDTVYFSRRGTGLDSNATITLQAQARWLLANPAATVRLEGHGDSGDSRDYALAMGDKRANEVRDFLIVQGIAPDRISVMSWGKERPGTVRVGPAVVAAGPRVVTKVAPPPPMPFPPVPAEPPAPAH